MLRSFRSKDEGRNRNDDPKRERIVAKFREEEKPEILFEDADDLRSELQMLIYAAQDRDAEARRMRYFER